MNPIFIGEHGTISIRLDLVEFVAASASLGDNNPTVVHMQSGKEIVLRHGNRDMFAKAWREYSDSKEKPETPVPPVAPDGKKRIITAIMIEERARSGGMAAYCACNDGTFWQYTCYNNYNAGPGESSVRENWYLLNPIPQKVIEEFSIPDVPQD